MNARQLTADEARTLLDAIDTATIAGLRDRTLIGVIKVLKDAFAKAKSSYSGDPKAFGDHWMKQKQAALAAAGF